MDLHAWMRGLSGSVQSFLDATGLTRSGFAAALILVGGFIVALILERISTRLAGRIARAIQEWGGGRTTALDAERAARAVGRTVYWLVVIFAVMAATETLGLPVVTTWLSGVATFLPRIAVAVVVVALGSLAGRVGRRVVTSGAASAGIPAAERLGRLTQVAVMIGTILVAVEQLGIEISFLKTSLLIVLAALLGGAALAFGLGARDVVANILSAHFVQKLYQVGQTIRIDGVEGRLVRITDTAVILENASGEFAVPARELADTRSVLVINRMPKP